MNQWSLWVLLVTVMTCGCSQQNGGGSGPLPSSSSEDVSHLLVKPESAAGEFDLDARRDYLPDPNIDWVVTIRLEQPIARERISGLLDIPWLESHQRPTVYGFSPDEKHWTYVSATDSPESFSSLKSLGRCGTLSTKRQGRSRWTIFGD